MLAVAALSTSCSPPSAPSEPLDFRRVPPTVESLTVRRVDASTAEFSVRLAPDARLAESLTIEGDREPIALRRQADGQYVGTAPFDVEALVARQRALDVLASRTKHPLTSPVFDGRVRVAVLPLPRLDVEKLSGGGVVALSKAWVTPDEVDAGHSLLVTDPTVVGDTTRTEDPCTGAGTPLGKWTFGYLMKQMAGSTDAAAMTRTWLGRWETAQTVNGLTIDSRPLIRRWIIAPWETASGGTAKPLDLAKAPFRLLAIVNRIDLAENLAYGSGSGGELRFVFGAVGPPPACTPLQFTVIFEFQVTKSGCATLRDWAQAWSDLGTLTLGSSAYNSALEALTEQIVVAGAAPTNPNGSALAQLRTNEIALLDLAANPGAQFWEMREFHLDTTGALAQTTVRRTPKPAANRTDDLATWVNTNASQVLADNYDVPDQYPGTTPFKGGDALTALDTFWMGPTTASITDLDARHRFSLNTCSGCHARETNTTFTHVSPTAPLGQAAPLSGFLTGISVTDPVSGATRNFADLDRRGSILADIANRSCVFQIFRKPNFMSH